MYFSNETTAYVRTYVYNLGLYNTYVDIYFVILWFAFKLHTIFANTAKP